MKHNKAQKAKDSKGSKKKGAGKPEPGTPEGDGDLMALMRGAAEDMASESGLHGSDRRDFVTHHEQIVAAYIQILNEQGLIPSAAAIARATGLSHTTVQKHFKDFNFDRFRKRLSFACSIAAGRLARKVTAFNADAYEIKTFFEIAGEIKTKVEHSGRVDYRTLGESVADGKTPSERARRLAELLASRGI